MAVAPAPVAAASAATTTRNAILDAAERRFADAGFAGASMREIAADVGLRNQASLYHHFPGKEALYEAVLARSVEALVPLWRGDGGPASLDGVLAYLEQHPHLARLIERAGIDDDPFVSETAVRLLRPLYAAGLDVLRSMRLGWDDEQLPQLAAGLYHMIFGYYASARLLEGVLGADPRSPRMLTRQREFLAAAVERLIAAAPTATTGGDR